MKIYITSLIHWLFTAYTIMIFIRTLMSWLPNLQHKKWVRFVVFYTDPFLGFFRQILPPVRGVLDLSPILAFFVLRVLEALLIGLIR